MQNTQFQQEFSQPFSLEPTVPQLIQQNKPIISDGKSLKFDNLVKFFNRFSNMRGIKKSNYVKQFLKIIFKVDRNPSFIYPIIRLMLPGDDRDRGNYGLKQKNLSKAIADSLNLTKNDYLRLHHYKNPSFHKNGIGIGDFSLCVHDVVKNYCKEQSTLTVHQLNQMLDQLVGSSKGHLNIFRKMFTVCNAEEIKWIIRIILKDLKINIKIGTVLNAFHPDAHDYFNLTNSLYETCKKFQDPNVSLDDDIKVFFPIRPMLAGKKKINFFQDSYKVYYVETKYDGQRLQAHKKGNQIRLFSRNAVDYSKIYEEFIDVIRNNVDADECILDGQIIVIEKYTHKMVPFGMNKVVALNKDSQEHRLCYKIFDILWLKTDGEDINLMKFELKQRKQLLNKVVNQRAGVIQIVKYQQLSEYDDIVKRFSQSLDRNEQGIMLKDPHSIYVPKQRGNNWTKLKGDYIEGLTDTLDLIILGGYFGDSAARYGPSKHWTDQITSFLIGVIDRIDPINQDIAYAIPFAKVGTGYSLQELNRLRQRLKDNLVKNEAKTKPSFLDCKWKPSLQDRPDCWINNLSRSIVLEVKAAEVIVSESYPTGHTLRFPRIVKIRYDKDWNEAQTMKNLQELTNASLYSKHLKRKLDDSDSEHQNEGRDKERQKEVSDKTVKKVKRDKEPRREGVYQQYLGYDFKGQNIESHLFSSFEFCVFSLSQSKYTKNQIQKQIMSHNGIVVQNPLPSTQYIVTDTIDFKLRAYQSHKSKKYCFIKPTYVINCIKANKILRLSPLYLTVIPQGNSRYYMQNYDRFGDSYVDFLDTRQLDLLLQTMDRQYQINDKLVDHVGLKKIRSGKVSMCLGVSQINKVKLRINGNTLVSSFDEMPDSVIIEGKLMPYEQNTINRYRTIKPDVKVEFIEQLPIF